MEKVSIITASYNYENYIGETIESVLAQTFSDWELVIVDDGSKDNSLEIIKSYCKKDSRIKLYTHENNQNKGLAETIQLGLKKAQNPWVAFLESDDKFAPDYLEEKIKAIKENDNLNFIFNDVQLIDENGSNLDILDSLKDVQKFVQKKKNRPANYRIAFRKRNYIYSFSCVMAKKELFDGLDFNSPDKPLLDYYLWAQLATKIDFYYIDKKLTQWRIHEHSYLSGSNGESIEFWRKICSFLNSKTIIFKEIKHLRRGLFRIKFGKKAQIRLFGNTIYESKR